VQEDACILGENVIVDHAIDSKRLRAQFQIIQLDLALSNFVVCINTPELTKRNTDTAFVRCAD
jgi:hypothetical protein